jgi:hypothetical protein
MPDNYGSERTAYIQQSINIQWTDFTVNSLPGFGTHYGTEISLRWWSNEKLRLRNNPT